MMAAKSVFMALVVELLGDPRVVHDGVPARPPRSRKTWALLAYLLLSERPPRREQLSSLLFPEADDPLGALRWSLSELRRLVGPGAEVGGDPVSVSLPPTAVVDVDVVRRGDWMEAVDLARLEEPLLEGVDVGSAAFELWLANERRRFAGAAGAVLHEAAQASLAHGDARRAVAYASRLVELGPLDEAGHVLLVECLRAAGDHKSATVHVAQCAELFRRELGTEPSEVLAEAVRRPLAVHAAPGHGSVRAMLEAAEAAVAAGAVSQGMETLRHAATAARRDGDDLLLARVLFVLGHTLVHAGKGGDEQGGAILHEAVACARRAGDDALAASACRELAFADLQRGRYDRAAEWVRSAAELAAGDDGELAWIEAISGACMTDQGRHAEAARVLSSAAARAERAASTEAGAFANAFAGRLHLLRRELPEAVERLRRAVGDARSRWLAWAPFPESLLAEAELLAGDVDASEARFERAFVMGRQLDDACIESISTRGLGLVAVTRGDFDRGYRLLVDAPRLSRRLPDSYLWIEAYGLDALAEVAVAHGMPAAARWVAALETVASRCGMHELLARAMLHRARLGEPGAREAALERAAAVDNPALHEALAATATA